MESLYDTQSFSRVTPNKQVITATEKLEYSVKKQLSAREIIEGTLIDDLFLLKELINWSILG